MGFGRWGKDGRYAPSLDVTHGAVLQSPTRSLNRDLGLLGLLCPKLLGTLWDSAGTPLGLLGLLGFLRSGTLLGLLGQSPKPVTQQTHAIVYVMQARWHVSRSRIIREYVTSAEASSK